MSVLLLGATPAGCAAGSPPGIAVRQTEGCRQPPAGEEGARAPSPQDVGCQVGVSSCREAAGHHLHHAHDLVRQRHLQHGSRGGMEPHASTAAGEAWRHAHQSPCKRQERPNPRAPSPPLPPRAHPVSAPSPTRAPPHLLEAHAGGQLPNGQLMISVDGRMLEHHSAAGDARGQHALQQGADRVLEGRGRGHHALHATKSLQQGGWGCLLAVAAVQGDRVASHLQRSPQGCQVWLLPDAHELASAAGMQLAASRVPSVAASGWIDGRATNGRRGSCTHIDGELRPQGWLGNQACSAEERSRSQLRHAGELRGRLTCSCRRRPRRCARPAWRPAAG